MIGNLERSVLIVKYFTINVRKIRAFLYFAWVKPAEVLHWHWCNNMTAPESIMTSSMETFSALLAICAGNSPVPGEFPAQRPVTRSFDIFFDLRLNKRWKNNPQAGDLRRYPAHYDVTLMSEARKGALLEWINVNTDWMNNQVINTLFVGYNYLSIAKLQRLNFWSLRIDM